MVSINFADVPEFSQLDPGTYHFEITDGDRKEHGPEAEHPGNEFWSLELTVVDGEKQGRKEFVTITLPPYKPFMLVSILRATAESEKTAWSEKDVQDGTFEVDLDDLIGLEFVARVGPQKKNPDFNQVSRIRAYDPETWAEADLLP
jgi:hypothetical protein